MSRPRQNPPAPPYVPYPLSRLTSSVVAAHRPPQDMPQIYCDANADLHLRRVLTDGTLDDLYVQTASTPLPTNLVTTTASQTLSNKTLSNTNTAVFKDSNFTLQDNVDSTKLLQWMLGSLTPGVTRMLTVPDVNDTLAVLNSAQTFSAATTFSVAPTLTTGTIKVAGQTLTFPAATDTVATLVAAQTLKNKTINGASNTVTNVCESPYMAEIRHSGTVSVANAFIQTLGPFNVIIVNKGSVYSGGRFVAPVAGMYLVGFECYWAGNAAGIRYLYINSSGLGDPLVNDYIAAPITSATGFKMSFTKMISMTANQKLELSVYQNSGAALLIGGTGGIFQNRAYFCYLGKTT